MGLLGKAIAMNNAHAGSGASTGSKSSLGDITSFVADFHRNNQQFHAIVFQGSGDILGMIACHGGVVADLPGGNVFVLLPGVLDRELFAHRLGHSAGLSILSQLSADSPSLALETLTPYLR